MTCGTYSIFWNSQLKNQWEKYYVNNSKRHDNFLGPEQIKGRKEQHMLSQKDYTE